MHPNEQIERLLQILAARVLGFSETRMKIGRMGDEFGCLFREITLEDAQGRFTRLKILSVDLNREKHHTKKCFHKIPL